MTRRKLILICQSGGEFVTNDDGTLSYSGGEANAVNVNCESLFDDLKLKLAEMCNLEYKTMSIKYFLPGNRRTLITLKNDKDLKRMFDFHGNSVTADIFVMGTEGFDREAPDIHASRGTGIKPAETVNHVVLPTTAANSSRVKRKSVTVDGTVSPTDITPPVTTVAKSSRVRRKSVAKHRTVSRTDVTPPVTTADSVVAVDAISESPTRASTNSPPSSDHVADYDSDYAPRSTVAKSRSPTEIDMTTTPADTVKKRRRTASWKIGANGPTIVSVADDAGRERKSRKKISQKDSIVAVTDEMEQKQDSPHKNPKDNARSISRDLGIELNHATVGGGIEDAGEQLEGLYKEAYNQLPWFCEKIVETNPGSFANLITNDDKRLQCLFVSFHASICGFLKGCRPILFLEANSVRSKYQEILLTATGVDGNDGFFPVAFAIVDVENDDNWRWFLEQLKSAVSTSQSITFVSNREKNLKKSVLEVFENANYGYSMYHLMESFKKNLKGPIHGDGKAYLPGHLLAAAHSVRLGGFKKYTEQIKQISSQAYDWVMQVEQEHWTSLSFKGERYNQIIQDVAEPYIAFMKESRELPIAQKVEAFIRMMTDSMNNRRNDSSGWSTKLTPLKESKLQEETIKARGLKVFISSDTLFEVRDDSSHVVNIGNWDCTCLGWKETGLPCCHAIAVFSSTGRSAYDYCSKYFTVNSFRLTYSESINPIRVVDKPVEKEQGDSTVVVLPPLPSGPPIQEEEERSEKEREKKRTVTCTRCKEAGHNKASCKAILPV